MTYLPQLRDQLVAAVPTAPRRRAWLRRPLVIALAVLVTVGVAAGALAATGVIPIGSPIHERASLVNHNPHRGAGVVVPGAVRLLSLRIPDPGGGPPWGLRVLGTTRGVGCVQIGRVVDGKLGVLGQDGVAHDDGRFHELPTNALGPWACEPLDAAGNLFLSVVQQGMLASGPTDTPVACVVPGEHLGPHDRPEPRCPAADERQIVYGLLGPQARSITYTVGGPTKTVPVTGPEGAYLIVARSHAKYGGATPSIGGVVGVRGRQGVAQYLLQRIDYADGSSCPKRFTGYRPAIYPCPPVGYKYPSAAPPTSAQVHRPLHIQARTVHHYGRQLRVRVSFRAPVAVSGAASHYELDTVLPHTGACRHLIATPRATDRDLAAGTLVRLTEWIPASCHGPVHETVRLVTAATTQQAAPLLLGSPSPGPVVGRFTVHNP